jgi:WXG100 family type VII secretion target
MPTPRFRGDYEALRQIAQTFAQHTITTQHMLEQLKNHMGVLQGGDWQGQGATKFFLEMDGQVLPAIQRLSHALDESNRVVVQISAVIQQAEDDSARLFRLNNGGPEAANTPGMFGTIVGGVIGGVVGGPLGAAAGAALGHWATGTSNKKTAADRMLSKFDSKVQNLAEKSPTLLKELEQLEKDGWRIIEGAAGKGSYADRTKKTIVVEKGRAVDDTLGTIAHESGHATYGDVPYHAPTQTMTRAEYLRLNVDECLKDEGNAQFNRSTVRAEIQKAKGGDIGWGGTQDYKSVYQNFQNNKITREAAIDQMANLIGKERTSTTLENYRTYYGKPYGNYWDKSIKRP